MNNPIPRRAAAVTAMPELQVLNGSLQWKTIPVAGARFLIGRKDGCHLILKDGWVSREHTLIMELKPGEFRVQDLDSENGTFLNGDRISDTAMKHGDVLRVGRTEMRFMQHTSSSQRPTRAEATPMVESLDAGLRTHTGKRDDENEDDDERPQTLKVDVFSKTSAEEGQKPEGPRIDLRERVRRLEAQLLDGEQGNAALAAENSVLKRALARLGVLDRTTGAIDPAKLVPRPQGAVPDSMLRFVTNPLARIRFPGVPHAADARKGFSNPALLDIGIVGVDAVGIRFSECMSRLGNRRAVAVTAERDAMRGGVIDPAWRIYVDRPKVGRSVHQPGVDNVFQPVMPRIDEVFAEAFAGCDRVLLCVDASGPLAADALHRLGDAVRGAGGVPGAVVFFDPTDDHVETHERAASALAQARTIAESGRFAPFIVIDLARAAAIATPDDGDAMLVALDSIAGALDAMLRVAIMPAKNGALDAKALRDRFFVKGWSTIGVGATSEWSRAAIEAAYGHALGAGLLCEALPASRARSAFVVTIVGAAKASETGELETARAVVGRLLPQAQRLEGVYEDAGESMRVIAFVGGLPYPETFFSERSAGAGRRVSKR